MTDPAVVNEPAEVDEPVAVTGPAGEADLSDAEEFASPPSSDDAAAVEVPADPMLTATAPVAPTVVTVTGPQDPAQPDVAGPADIQVPTYATAPDTAAVAMAAPLGGAVEATQSPGPMVSDEDEFSSMPPPADEQDDAMEFAPSAANGDQTGFPAEAFQPAGVGVPTSGDPNPVITDGGGQLS